MALVNNELVVTNQLPNGVNHIDNHLASKYSDQVLAKSMRNTAANMILAKAGGGTMWNN